MRPDVLSSWMRPVGVMRRCCAPGQMYNVPGSRDSFASASFTRTSVNSASCEAYCVVNAAGMCCTRITAAGKSRVNPGAIRMTVAGPPVEAARTTTGNLWSSPDEAAGRELLGVCGRTLALPIPCNFEASREAVRTTRTLEAMRTLRRSSSFTLCISRSMPLEGLATNSMAPSSSARSVLAAPSLDSELTITIGRGFVVIISAVACNPSTWGMLMSIVMTSGLSDSASETASRPSLAWPTTCSNSSALKMVSSTLHMNAESSTISTRNFLVGVAIVRLRHRNNRAGRLRSYKLFHHRNQLIFLNRLGQERRRAFLHRAIAMLRARSGSDDQHWNPARRRVLPQLHHQFVPGHARHFEVGDDQVAAMLRHEFGGFHSVGRQFHAIPVLFEHPADELAHADGVVRHDDYTLLLDTVDRLRRNRSARNRRGPRRKNARRAGACLERTPLARFRCHHAVQVNQKNQAAIRRNCRARKELYAAKILAHVLDFVGTQAANFLDDRQGQRKVCRSAPHKQCRRDDQRERHLKRELRALSACALDIDFAVERIQVGAHDVKPNTPARQFRLDRRGRKARVEKHFAKVALRQPVRGFGRYEAALDRALLHTLVINSPPVVFHFNIDVIAPMVSAQRDVSRCRLACGRTVVAVLDTVRYGISHQVHQRVGNLLNDVVVEFCFAAREVQLYLLAGRFRRIPHRA